SGAGKSTLLKLLIGFDHPDEDPNCLLRTAGIDLVGKEGNGAMMRKLASLVSYVSQKPTLLPHLSVEENLLFGLKRQYGRLQNGDGRFASRGVVKHLRAYTLWLLADKNPAKWRWPKATREGTLEFESPLGLLIRFMGLDEKMESLPSQLSGGEAQRVHLLRWLILGRPMLVMDEAFSALDQPLKGMVRDAIVRNSHAFGTTVLNVSHERADVLQVSDRILFIHEKKVVEKAPPAALYYEPRSCDLAVFLGHSNIFQIHRDPHNRKLVFLDKDVYRDVVFTPPVPVRIDEDERLADGLVFIPRSYVNINDVADLDSTRAPTDAMEWLQMDDLRFTGTHYEARLSLPAGSPNLVLDAVIQDDDLGRLTRGQHRDPSFMAQKPWARMSIHKVIEIKGTSE
ncbi:MAG: ATP-binding cassette domain-containing protein, partial [bacterium]